MSRRSNVVAIEGATTSARTSITLSEVWALYCESMQRRQLSEYTVKHETENVRAVSKLINLDRPANSYGTSELEQVFDVMREAQLSPVTINHRVKTVKRLFSFAVIHGYLRTNPAEQVELMREPKTPIPSFSGEQLNTLFAKVNLNTFTGLRDLTMYLLVLDCGVRLRETLELTIQQVNLKERLLVGVRGKNQDICDVPLTDEMVEQLALYLQVRGALSTDALFVTLFGTPIARRTVQERLHDYGMSAKIENVRVSPHTLRHTFAKQWILNGGDVFSLQDMMRHHSMEMVRRYVHMWGTELQNQHDKFSPLKHLKFPKKR